MTGLRVEILIGLFAAGLLTTCFVAYALCSNQGGAKTVNMETMKTTNTPSNKRKKVKRDQFIIVGPSDSGKTLLYYQLVGGKQE